MSGHLQPSNPPEDYLEDILQQDQNDYSSLPFGASEQHVASTLLILATIPSIGIPSLSKIFKKNIQFSLFLSAAFIIGTYFVIQYRFNWIIYLTHQLRTLYYYERI